MFIKSGKIITLMCIFLLLLLLCANGLAEDAPEDVIQTFVEAYNRLDADAMLTCMEPMQATAFKNILVASTGGDGMGFSGNDLLRTIPLFVGFYSDE